MQLQEALMQSPEQDRCVHGESDERDFLASNASCLLR